MLSLSSPSSDYGTRTILAGKIGSLNGWTWVDAKVEGKPYVGAMPPISAVAEGTYVREVLCCVLLCCVVLCCVVLCSILLCCTAFNIQ
jgi:hypothetical protein